MEKLFRYFRVYSYGDCVEEYLIVANNKDEAIEKLRDLKIKNNACDTTIKADCISEVTFVNGIANLV